MSLRESLYTAITNDAAIAALISDRCYPDRLPENAAFPAVVFVAFVSDDDREYRTHDLGMVERSVARSQLSAYANTGDDADRLASLLIALFSGHRGGAIGSVQVANRVSTVETAIDRYRTIVDLLIDYKR